MSCEEAYNDNLGTNGTAGIDTTGGVDGTTDGTTNGTTDGTIGGADGGINGTDGTTGGQIGTDGTDGMTNDTTDDTIGGADDGTTGTDDDDDRDTTTGQNDDDADDDRFSGAVLQTDIPDRHGRIVVAIAGEIDNEWEDARITIENVSLIEGTEEVEINNTARTIVLRTLEDNDNEDDEDNRGTTISQREAAARNYGNLRVIAYGDVDPEEYDGLVVELDTIRMGNDEVSGYPGGFEFNEDIEVERNETTLVVLEIDFENSLYNTGDDEQIFLPVVSMQVWDDIEVGEDDDFSFTGGRISANESFAVNRMGRFTSGDLGIDSDNVITVTGNRITVSNR